MRPTPATDQQDRAYAANIAALRLAQSDHAHDQAAIETVLDLCRAHLACAKALRGEAEVVA